MPNRTEGGLNSQDDSIIHRALPGRTIVVLKEISGGRSGARLVLIDLAPNPNIGATVPVNLEPGQYILKIQAAPSWPGEETESERHASAVGKNPQFAAQHIPALRFSTTIDQMTVLLYELAGQSLVNFVAADSVDVGALQHYCDLISHTLLDQWNASYEVSTSAHAIQTLKAWLEYRLVSNEAPNLHKFIGEVTKGNPIFLMGGRVLVNPLWLVNADSVHPPASSVNFVGKIHGDLHPGNILVDCTRQHWDQYWLIDFDQSKVAPLGFDHYYLELALLTAHLRGAAPQRLLTILEALEAEEGSRDALKVPVTDLGLLGCIRALRAPIRKWQTTREPRRQDSVTAQMFLAQVAAGINWANKPLEHNQRLLALGYAARAAKRYLEVLAPHSLEGLLTTKREPTPPPVTPEWSDVWDQLNRFDTTRAKFVLVTSRLATAEENKSLALVPWSAVIDLDPQSSENGLHASVAPLLARVRSLNQFGRNPIPVDFDRGTAWLMANGWPSRSEAVPAGFRQWRREYGGTIRDLCRLLRQAATPLPVKVVILATPGLDKEYLRSTVALVDESLEGLSDITVVGTDSLTGDSAVKAQYPITAHDFIVALHQVFGSVSDTAEPTLPGSAGPVCISLEQLRNLEEDLTILHSRILDDTVTNFPPPDAFWKGNPPTWADLHAGSDVCRQIGPTLLAKVSDLLEKRRNNTIELHHAPGSGGTTVALRCGWDLHLRSVVAILRQYSRTTADRIDQLYRLSQQSVLLIAEAAVLPPSQREELYREISRRNARCVILYVMRGFAEGSEDGPDRQVLADPMNDTEARAFLRAFSLRTTDARRVAALHELTTSLTLQSYRSPFLYGLTTYEEDFESVDRFVAAHLGTATPPVKRVVRYLALVTRYTQTGISLPFVNTLLGLDAASDTGLAEELGSSTSRLTIRREHLVRLLHPIIAEEVLRQCLGQTDDWRYGLKTVALELIDEAVGTLGNDATETLHLFTELFIRRDPWTLGPRRRRHFSELIVDIPTPAGQHQVLQRLTEVCPMNSHFWNHLGRHHIYEMKQDFPVAEGYIKRAIELSESDQFHHHALGMVRRFWIRSQIAGALKSETRPTAAELFQSISTLLDGAAEEFRISRQLASDEEHGYITHIQMVIEVLEVLVRLNSKVTFPVLLSRSDDLGMWIRREQVIVEDLLERVRHMHQQQVPSRYELQCQSGLATLYGNFKGLIESLEDLALKAEDSDVRRALATAFFAKSGRAWVKVPSSELSRMKNLMEKNLSDDPTNAHDIRTWFQAARRLPEFSYIDAIAWLESWANASHAVDAYYYLYILHFLRWREGIERDEDELQKNLELCRKQAEGRRGLSHEWLASQPTWCPLVHASELGEWLRERDFFEHPEALAWATGAIATIKPQAGTLRLGPRTLAHFVPGTKFSESRHLNTLVKFYLGFSYEGLRAWSVDFATKPTPQPNQVQGGQPMRTTSGSLPMVPTRNADSPGIRADQTKQVGPTRVADSRATVQGATALGTEVERFLRDEVRASQDRREPYSIVALGFRLAKRFGPKVHERLGFECLTDLVKALDFVEMKKEGTFTLLSLRSPQ